MNKRIFLAMILLAMTSTVFGQEVKYQLSSHILDITQGQPASNVEISLSKQDENAEWVTIDKKCTDENGRIQDFLKQDSDRLTAHHGIYKLTYFTAPYFEEHNQDSFYPFIEVVFEIKDDKHYHVPITLSPFGYSTYRGN